MSWKVPVGQVWSGFKFSTKPDQPGLSSSIRLEVMYVRTQVRSPEIGHPVRCLGHLTGYDYYNMFGAEEGVIYPEEEIS